jgi:hypothetical protein
VESPNFIFVILVFVSLLVLPPFAFLVYYCLRRFWPKSVTRLAGVGAILVTATIVAAYYDFDFGRPELNVLWCLGVYFAYCLATFSCLRIRAKILRFFTILILAQPIALGYLMSTIGSLGTVFLLGDFLASPVYSHQEDMGLNCSVTGWGGAWGSSGYKGSLYRSWHFVPFLRKEIAWIDVNQSDEIVTRSGKTDHPEPVQYSDYCSQLMSDYRISH